MAHPPVVLLPGMMLDERSYARQLGALGPECQFISLTGGATVRALAEAVLAAAPPRFALVGLSLGGIVALEVWRRGPGRVSHLGLLDTTPLPDQPERRALRLEQIAQVERGRLRDVLVGSMKPLYLAERHRSNRRLLASIVAQGLALGADTFRSQSLALRERPDSTPTLPTIDCPALVLAGREDALCPVERQIEMAAAIPRADLVLLAECGHLSTMEEPSGVNAALRRLLRRPAR